MRVDFQATGSQLRLSFLPEAPDQPRPGRPGGPPAFSRSRRTCNFQMPAGWRLQDCHPDLQGCAAVALSTAFQLERLWLPTGVSPLLQQTVAELFHFRLEPCDARLPPRPIPAGGRPGLCFSAGIDSTAALLLAPPDTAAVFLERIPPPDGLPRGRYDKSAPLRACRVLGQAGREVWAIPSDLEYLREPLGFFNDLTMAVPLILLADWRKLDSIAYGLILESAYLNKGRKYRAYVQSSHFRQFNGLAACVGLPFHLITAGLSEVATTRLVMESPFHHLAQSCMRGPFARPCLSCWKCFRKTLLEAALRSEPIPDDTLRRFLAWPEIRHQLAERPLKHENVIAFIVQRYRGSFAPLVELGRRLEAETLDLRWVTRWYPQAGETLAARHRAAVEASIGRFIPSMEAGDLERLRAWDRLGPAR